MVVDPKPGAPPPHTQKVDNINGQHRIVGTIGARGLRFFRGLGVGRRGGAMVWGVAGGGGAKKKHLIQKRKAKLCDGA